MAANWRVHTLKKGARSTPVATYYIALMAVLAGYSPTLMGAADAERGRALHESCLSCHGTSIYLPPRRKIDTYKKLGAEVERWNRSYNPKFTKAEIADIMLYLNESFYKFPVK